MIIDNIKISKCNNLNQNIMIKYVHLKNLKPLINIDIMRKYKYTYDVINKKKKLKV